MTQAYAIPDHELARAVDRVIARSRARFLSEVLDPLLRDLRALECALQREFLDSRTEDDSGESIEWFADNARRIIAARQLFTRITEEHRSMS